MTLLEAAKVLGVTGFQELYKIHRAKPENNHKRIRLETQSLQLPSSSYACKVESEQTRDNNIEEALANVKTEITEEDSKDSQPQNLLHSAPILQLPSDPGPLMFPDPYSFCSRCKDVFDKRANPIPCIKCNLWFHLKCRGGHSC